MDVFRRLKLTSNLNSVMLNALNKHFRFIRYFYRFSLNRPNRAKILFGKEKKFFSWQYSSIWKNYFTQRFGGFAAGTSSLIGAVGFFGSFDSDDFFGEHSGSKFFRAVRENNLTVVKSMIKNGENPNQRHFLGWTPLHVAAFHGSIEMVELLVKNGADVNSLDEYSTFKITGDKTHLSQLEVLYQRQNDFSSNLRTNSNFRGTTALHYAVLGNHIDIVKLLIEKGADPTIRNEAGHTPFDYARDDEIKDVLKEYAKLAETIKQLREKEERVRYPLEQRIKEVLVGQEGAVSTVAETIRRKENGWYDDEHPLVFLFLGSSGIGKTELAKQVAKYLHKDQPKAFIRIDMSEYQTKHEVAKFIGSPPGYIGHDEGGQLTKKLKDFPNAVVLFDEVEKAHPDILTIMLQLFDEGRLTDGKGKTIECKQAIFIMTSNLASEVIAEYATKLRQEAMLAYREKMSLSQDEMNLKTENVTVSKQFKEKVVQPILKKNFKRDEFLGRITEMVYFLPFSRSELILLVTKELELWQKRAKERHNVELIWDENVLDVLADGYNVSYGARSIKHEIERRVVNKLATAHERELIRDGAKVRVFTNLPSDPSKYDNVDRSKATIELEVIEKGGEKNTLLGSPLLKKLSEIFV